MANDLVRFATGLESNLSQEAKEKGKILFAVTGDNKGYIYFDKDNNTRIKMSEHALTAEKDAANNTITTTYLKSIALNSSTINTYSIKSIAGANTTKDIITIPNASTTKAGLITGEAQTLGGDKTFNNSVTINDKLTVNEDIISLAGEPYMAQKEYTNILCTANNNPNGYLYYGQLKLKDYYTEWYLKMYISMDIPYDSTKANTDKASYEGIVEYWGYANVITAYRIFNAHANTSYRTFYSHLVYRTTLAGCQTYGNLLGFRFYSSWNPASTGYGRNIKIKVIHTDNCSFNFLDNMVLYANAPGTGSTNFTDRSEYDGWNNGLRESGDDNTRNHLIGALYLKAGESCIDRYTIVMQEKGGDFSSICYKNATSNINDTATNHIKSTSHYVVGGPVYYAYNNAHTNAGVLSSYLEFHTNYPLTFTYSSNSGATLTNGKMVYLKFEKDSEGYLTIPDHPWYSLELPTEEDGYVYMTLGIAYSTSLVYMFPEHEYYEYIAGQIRKYVHNLPVKQGGTGKTSWTANLIVYASAATTLSQLPSGTDGLLLKSKGTSAAPEWISPSSLLVGKATGDSAGDNIRSTYIKSLSVNGTTLTITKGDNSTSTLTLLDTNTDTKVTNTLNTTTKAYVTGTTSSTTNTGTQIFDTGVYLDTTAGLLVATKFVGALQGNADTATKATGDSAGDNIRSTYIKSLSVSGTTLTITKGDSTTSTITLQDTNTDTKVTNTLGTKTKAYVTGTTSATTNTGTLIFDTGVYLDTTAGLLVATTFKGALDGNASTATKATGDSAGDNIRSTYIKGLSVTGNDTTDVNGTTTITAGSKGFYTVTTGANASTKFALPIAGESVAGIVVNTAQTWKGVKTFSTGVTVSAASGFEYSGIETGTSTGARPVWYSYLGKNGKPVIDASHFTYNPGTQTLTVANLNGLAAKATADAANNTITTTYLAKISENSSTINSYSIKSSVGGNLSGTKDTVTIPNASTTKAGLITGEAQTLGGDKTFNDEVVIKDVLTAEKDIISANGYPYIEKKTYTDIIATANNTTNGCFYLADIRPDNFYEAWSIRLLVHAYVSNHKEYDGLYDITISGYYSVSGSNYFWNVVYSNFNSVNTSYRPIYYSDIRTLNKTGYDAGSPILWGVDLYASTNPTNTNYKRTVDVILLNIENCTFTFKNTPIVYANVPNASHYHTYYNMDCANTGLRESADNDTYDRTYATNYVRVGSSPIHRYSLIMQDTTDGFSSLVYKTRNSNDNNNSATGHVAATDVHFIPTGLVLWNSSGSWYNTSGNQTGSIGMYTAIPFDFRYASNCSASLTVGKPVYYVFNKNVDDNTLSIDSTIHTLTLPTTEDGKVYMFLGIAYATTHIYLHHAHPMYEFIDGKLRTYRETIPVKQGGTGKTSWTANGLIYASGTSTLALIGTGTDGQFLKSKGANAAPVWTNASDIAVNKAEKDGAGNTITTHYIKHGSISVSDANHNMTYTNGANGDTKTVSLPFVKLSGDTMTGLLTLKAGQDVHSANGVAGTGGYVKIATLVISGAYQNLPITMEISRRNDNASTILNIQFQNNSSNDPNLSSFNYFGPCSACFIKKSATSTWDLYIQKNENYDTIYVTRYHKPYNSNITLTWKNELLEAAIADWTQASLIAKAASSDKAEKDGAGNQITTTYAKAGSFATDTTNHKITYTDGANIAKEFSTPFVLQTGDSMTGNLTTTGNMTAVKFIGALQGNADSASTLSHKTLDNTTLENTAGSFAFSGSGLPWDNTDWVGLQIGNSVDKFLITANDGGLLFRQNDSGGTATSGWTSWTRLAYTPINTQVGSSTKGVYVSNKGALTACSYELKATVNNATQYGVAYYSTTTNITSTAAGGANTALMGKGSAAPAFVSVSPTLTLTAGTTAGPKVKITVLGVTGTDLQLPSAGNGASGVVTTDTQTFAGAKTFNNSITINGNVDSTNSLSTSASVVVKGGVSVAKNLSAKTIRIDNNQTTEGVLLQYDETLDTLNFVFV